MTTVNEIISDFCVGKTITGFSNKILNEEPILKEYIGMKITNAGMDSDGTLSLVLDETNDISLHVDDEFSIE